MDLRAWQREALEAIGQWDGQPAIIRAVMGAGKSVVIARAARMFPAPVVVAAPSIHLVEQLLEDMPDAVAYYTGAKGIGPLTVTTYHSLGEVAARLDGCELLVCDEAHSTENPRALAAIEALKPKRILGFTATDWRADRRESLSVFQSKLVNYGPADALRDGVVVPFEVIPHTGTEADLDAVAVAMTREAVRRGPTLVNAWNIADSEAFAERLRSEGIRAEAVHSGRRDKAETLERLRTGELQAATHVDQLREGVNLPWLVCLVARRQRSRVSFPQEVGRVLRAHPGKDRAYIYDPLDLFGELGLDYEACLGGDAVVGEDGPEIPVAIARAVATFKAACRCKVAYAPGLVLVRPFVSPSPEAWRVLGSACDAERWDLRLSRPKALELPPAVAVEAAHALIRQLAIAWRSCGAIDKVQARAWRKECATERQIQSLGRMLWTAKKVNDLEHKEQWRLVLEQAAQGHYDRGTTSDVWSILRASEQHGWRLWPESQSGSQG